MRLLSPALLCLALLGATGAWAQPAPDARTEPAVERLVNEDDNIRIEELRVRGEMRSIVVHSKTPGVRAYEILPSTGASDPSQPGSSAGRRVWSFRF